MGVAKNERCHREQAKGGRCMEEFKKDGIIGPSDTSFMLGGYVLSQEQEN